MFQERSKTEGANERQRERRGDTEEKQAKGQGKAGQGRAGQPRAEHLGHEQNTKRFQKHGPVLYLLNSF